MPQMNKDTYPQEVILLDERYPATLKEVNEYTKDYGEGPVSKLAWIFAVKADEDSIDPDVDYEEDPTGVYEIAAHTSFATGPNSNFASLGFPKVVGDEWDGDTDKLVGKSFIVDITSYETKGGQTRNVVEKVRPPRKGQKPVKTTASGAKSKSGGGEQAKDEESEDFDEIPF